MQKLLAAHDAQGFVLEIFVSGVFHQNFISWGNGLIAKKLDPQVYFDIEIV